MNAEEWADAVSAKREQVSFLRAEYDAAVNLKLTAERHVELARLRHALATEELAHLSQRIESPRGR